MCYSEKASWGAFALGAVGIVAGVARGAVAKEGYDTKVRVGVSLALITLVLMQLWEALMHRGKDVMHLAMVTNFLQPLAVVTLLLVVTWPYEEREAGSQRGGLWTGALTALAFYVFFISFYLKRAWGATSASPVSHKGDCSASGTHCRLTWPWVEAVPKWVFFFFVASIAMAMLLVRPWGAGVALSATVVGTLLLGIVAGKPNGSKWCFFAIALPVLLAALPVGDAVTASREGESESGHQGGRD